LSKRAAGDKTVVEHIAADSPQTNPTKDERRRQFAVRRCRVEAETGARKEFENQT